MQVSVESTSGVVRRMTIGIPKEGIEPKIQERLKSLAHQSKINGFRPGKVPMRVVEQRYGQKVRQEIANEIIHTSFGEAIAEEKLRVVGETSFEMKSDIRKLEQGMSYSAIFEIYPDITTLHVDGLAVEKPVAEITDADVDTLLSRLREQRKTWNEVDRPGSDGDRVIIDFVGTIDGKPFKGNEFKQVPVILGQNNFILPGFEEKLMGAGKGDDREFDLTFSKDHKNPALAGQTVHFVVQVSKVDEQQLPEIDEEFIKLFGVSDGRIETLRTEARRNMERELKYVTEEKVKQQILGALLKANPIEEIPQSLVKDETQHLLKIRQQELQTQNLSANMFKEEARQRVKIGLLVRELMKKYHLQANPDKVRQLIEKFASVYENPQAVVQEYYADKQRLGKVESIVLEDEVVAWLLERAQINEKQTDFYSVVESTQQVANI
ncbi:MAG: trigger factor [Pseudomonadota bacterium]